VISRTYQPIVLHNSLVRAKQPFVPIDPKNVRMYVCGPTVYDYAHIGNARPVIVFDVLYRLLRHVYGADHVTYVRNITDVDDKINARAAKQGISIRELTEGTTAQYHQDVAALGCLPPNIEPRATEHIDEMKEICETLLAKGNAYVAEGHVLFSVSSMPDYGKLSNRDLEEMQAGARIEVASYKRDPMDFVLWKPSKIGEPGWPSPCGIEEDGRPGWHIECSAMSAKHLGKVFDIHGGGVDLIFPHHENEIAQSRCAHGTKVMANVWLHNAFLNMEAEKMSKSLGNVATIDSLLQVWPGEVLRFNMLGTHYRQPINWSVKGLAESKRTLDHWYQLTADVADSNIKIDEGVLAALSDDLNTPKAIAVMHELRHRAAQGDDEARGLLKGSANLLGLLQLSVDAWIGWRPANSGIDEAYVEELISQRRAAREAKDWARSDSIRDELAEKGVALKDSKDRESGEIHTTWEIKL